MPKLHIVESVGSTIQNVHSYRDLEHHHPSKHLQEAGRVYATVDGEREEVAGDYNGNIIRTRNGNVMVSKDLILMNPSNSDSVPVPAPASGFIGGIDKRNGVVEIYDKPGGEMIARIRHMDLSNFNLKNGDQIQYGQPMGIQSGYGKGDPNFYGTHTHIDYNAQYLGQFKQYITDIDKGVITTDRYPQHSGNISGPAPVTGNSANAMADGVLQLGEKGPEVKKVQEQLIKLGYKGADGKPLSPDSDFGNNTKFAVEAFQRASKIGVDGKVGEDTIAALKKAVPAQAPATPTTPSSPTPSTGIAATGATSVLSNLVGRGESGGSYNAYNKGTTSDRVPPLNLTDMTVGEIIRRQHLPKGNPDYMFAAGKFQMVGPPSNTMGETVRALGIDPNAKFTPELQEKMFANYLIDGKRPAVNDYITGKSSGAAGLEKAQHALALEFASVGDPRKGGRGAYDGDSAGNSASISVKETATALNQMRAEYQANIAKGLSPDAAYDALRGQAPTQGNTKPSTPGQTGAMADGVLKQGEKGPEVKALQEQLNRLGFKDAQGRSLNPDSDFGDRTRQAVEAFQRARGIEVDGKVGNDTFAELKKAEAQKNTTAPSAPPTEKKETAALLSDGKHADNPMYQQADALLAKLPAGTFKSEQERHNAAASLTYEAKLSGMTKIDSISLNTSGTGLIAVQGAMQDPAHQRIFADKAQAAAQPIETSTKQLQQDVQVQALATPQQEQQKKAPVSI